MRGSLEARQLIDKRTVELARLRWTLEGQARRLRRSTAWLEGDSGSIPAPASREPSAPAPQDAGRRKVHIRVKESREVSVTLEDAAPAADPDVIEHPHRPEQ